MIITIIIIVVGRMSILYIDIISSPKSVVYVKYCDTTAARCLEYVGGGQHLVVVGVGRGHDDRAAVAGAGPDERFALAAGRGRRGAHQVGHLRHLSVAPDHGAGPRVADRRPERGVARVPGRQERHERNHERAPVLAAHCAV